MAMRPGQLHLTFDDGPDPVWTPRVLDALADVGAGATFFVLVERLDAAPETAAAIRAAGHVIELHGWAHLRHPLCTREVVALDAARALERLAREGIRPTRWRLPWGDPAPWSPALAAELGLTITGWSGDTHDWRGDSAVTMAEAIAPVGSGDVVLCHDGLGPGSRRGACRETVAFVARAAALALEAGLELAPLPPASAGTA